VKITFSTQVAYYLEELSNIFTKYIAEMPYKTDGLVLTPARKPYKLGVNDILLKWKPPSLNTVDFLLRVICDPNTNKNHYSLEVQAGSELKHYAWLTSTKGLEERLSGKL